MGKTRDNYLNLHWTRYPQMPLDFIGRGRVGEPHLLMANLQNKIMSDAPDIKVMDVLIDSDIVALLPNDKVMLLAPALSLPVPSGWDQYRKWPQFVDLVREFFKSKSFQEVKTPTLVNCPGTEPSLDVFSTEFQLESKRQTFYLPTSPELNLKKLLAAGAENIFEIASVFRNGEVTPRHSPEFTMLEWYRAFSDLQQIKTDSLDLITFLCEKSGIKAPGEIISISVAELFKQFLNYDFKPETSEAGLRELAKVNSVDVTSAESIDDCFFLIFMDKIEFRWPKEALVFVEKYPPYQAALARVGQDGWAERFEIYWAGFELANAFHELNDPVLQRKRADEDLAKKLKLKKKQIPLDEKFFKALECGLPPSGGIALGLERLYMVLHSIDEIDQLRRLY